jgi:hypothetical protein
MPFSHQFKPAHKEIKRYYEELDDYKTHEVAHEGATSSAFQNLLAATRKKADQCFPLCLRRGRYEPP